LNAEINGCRSTKAQFELLKTAFAKDEKEISNRVNDLHR